MKIVYMNDNGVLAVIHPIDQDGFSSIQAYAETYVPTGKPFKILDNEDIPSDRTYRDAWVMDESELNDGIGK